MKTEIWAYNATLYLQRLSAARNAIGAFMLDKFRQQCAISGVQAAAKNLRKQGVPLDVALTLARAL